MTLSAMRRAGPRLRSALLFTLLPLSRGAARAEDLRIGSIRVTSVNVFSPEEASRGWVYRLADAVHWTTREKVIRRFLLFREGDAYDPARLAETERNLRALPFVKFASVEAEAVHDGVVDVEVLTQDAWTTEPGVSLGRKGGITTFGFDVTEKNLLGTGRQLTFDFDKGTERTTRFFEFRDPSLFGPYWAGNLLYARNSDGGEERLAVRRPFFSFATPWAVQGILDDLRQNERIFEAGALAEMFHQRHRELSGEYDRALAVGEERARRVGVGVDWLNDDFAPLAERPGDVLPSPRRFRYVYLRYSDLRNEFLKLNYVNRDVRYEDFNLGAQFDATVGVSPAAFGAPASTGLVRIAGSIGRPFGAEGFVLASGLYETRINRGLENEIASATLELVRKLETSPRQTFLARVQFTRGWRLDRDVQFAADGDTGLRGYRLHAFEGDKSLVVNLEQRFFSGREILQLVAPGAAVFFDAGGATPPGAAFGGHDIKKDAGLGLRLGIPRAATNNVIRIDLAYAIDRDARGRRGFLLSFSSSQAF